MITNALALIATLFAKRGDDEDPRAPQDETKEPDVALVPEDTSVIPFPVPDPPALPLEVRKVGAWTGWSSMNTPKAIAQTIKACTFLGLRRLDIIVNDDAEERDPIPYKTYDAERIVALARAAAEASIDVHLMSWIMPHERYIDGAAAQLRELVARTGAKSIQWDAEEPWTQARKALPYDEAAKRVADSFGGITMGVNGIGYTPAAKFGPIAEVCSYLVPQCYATSTSGLDPMTVVPTIVRRWRSLFGRSKQIVCGLAAYRQPPRGYTVESSMRAAYTGAMTDLGIHEVIYWSLGSIRQSATVSRVVKALASGS